MIRSHSPCLVEADPGVETIAASLRWRLLSHCQILVQLGLLVRGKVVATSYMPDLTLVRLLQERRVSGDSSLIRHDSAIVFAGLLGLLPLVRVDPRATFREDECRLTLRHQVLILAFLDHGDSGASHHFSAPNQSTCRSEDVRFVAQGGGERPRNIRNHASFGLHDRDLPHQ